MELTGTTLSVVSLPLQEFFNGGAWDGFFKAGVVDEVQAERLALDID